MTNPYDIVVAQPVHPSVAESLKRVGNVFINPGPEPMSPAELANACQSARALMAFMTERIDRPLLQACPKLQIVAGALKGFDNVDLAACEQAGVRFTYIPDLLTEPTAELTIGLMIALARHVRDGDAHMRSGTFTGWRPTRYGGSINGATVGVVGAGAVGQTILRMLSGFDCRRIYTDTQAPRAEHAAQLQAQAVPFDQLISESDFVVLATPLTPDTLHLVDAAVIARMKPGSYLVNPARGSVVNEHDVAAALQSGHLGGYAADVFEMEDQSRGDAPSTVDPGILAAPNTVLTPHLGSAVRSVREAIEQAAANEIIRALS